jgi:hypothetical protein
MSQLARVVEVEHLGEHRLRLRFSDGLVRELDFADAVTEWGGVFEPLADPAFFAQVAVDPVTRTNRRADGLPPSSSSTASARRPDRSCSVRRIASWSSSPVPVTIL